MTEDLITWLSAVLDEDERLARAATPGPWKDGAGTVALHSTGMDEITGYVHEQADIDHIVRHDPAAVLADIAAKRQIVAIHNVWTAIYPEDAVHEWRRKDRRCIGCGFNSSEEPNTPDVNDCPTLRALASAYAHQPGYRQEWAPR